MKKIILLLSLTLLAPASASANGFNETATASIEVAAKTALDAKTKAELALVKAQKAEATSKKTVKDVEALRIKTMNQLKAVKKQLDVLTKLLKSL
jgi:hypothetical protein